MIMVLVVVFRVFFSCFLFVLFYKRKQIKYLDRQVLIEPARYCFEPARMCEREFDGWGF